MNQKTMFSDALWVCAGKYEKFSTAQPDKNGVPNFPILRATRVFPDAFAKPGFVKKATLRVVGLGFFHCYLNGEEITDDRFLPLSTDYEERDNYPTDECLTGHRMYVPEYDVTDRIRAGKNVIAVHFGGGWYTFDTDGRRYGDPKAIFSLHIETEDGCYDTGSAETDKIGDSYVKTYYMPQFECQDRTDFDDTAFAVDFDDSAWKNAEPAKPVETEFLFCDCPADRTVETLSPVRTAEEDGFVGYDATRNISGYPLLCVSAKKGETVEVIFAEERTESGMPDMQFNHGQHFTYVSDGKKRIVSPQFTWFAFRYFKIRGAATPVSVSVVHTDVPVNSAFTSSNETLNWLYHAYLNTQLDNMHAGIPSDCPHIERRGYTGDGELTCHAAMTAIDAEKFYHKWIADIGDCQDIYSGHVQYTAPYTRCGGGPGAWGCAIVEVPYEYYLQYGDTEPLARLYPQMLRYFDYLEAHSVNGLVASDKKNEWCLGDWCAPLDVYLPAPFVNNYYYIKSLKRTVEIARLVGRECDIPMLEKKIGERKAVTQAAYFNTWDGNFIGGLQGANAFAVDMGIGDDRTYRNLVKYYTNLGRFDTGICGTDVVARVLFEHGDGALAASLMMSADPISFDGMRQAGATTIWENWPHAVWDRSRNHPMFGAVVAYLFDYLLGVRQESGKVGYDTLVINPVILDTLPQISGRRTVPAGAVDVSYTLADGTVTAEITVPAGVCATFRYKETEKALSCGKNRFTFSA